MPGPIWALWAGGICSVSPGQILPVCNCAGIPTCLCASIGVHQCEWVCKHLCVPASLHVSMLTSIPACIIQMCRHICVCVQIPGYPGVCIWVGCVCVCKCEHLCTRVLLLFVHLSCCPFVCLSLHTYPRVPPCVSMLASLRGYVCPCM